jgi:hypothetical protein
VVTRKSGATCGPSLSDENDIEAWIAAALEEQRKRNELPFAIIDLRSGQPVGSTRYFTIAQKDRGLEIGSMTAFEIPASLQRNAAPISARGCAQDRDRQADGGHPLP